MTDDIELKTVMIHVRDESAPAGSRISTIDVHTFATEAEAEALQLDLQAVFAKHKLGLVFVCLE